ncbi:MAG: ArdC family protein, partial [Desulfovibrio piger]
MSPAKERKNRFQVSREVQEEFVNGIAETMLSLAEKAGKWQQGWTSDTPVGMPFCPVTGREYSGANMVRLLLASIARGYADDRWMTFRQLQTLQEAHPELKMNIRKGEHGVKVLRPEEVAYIV